MTLPLISLALALLALFAGAEGLVRGSASLARRLGLTPLTIGLTVVAFGTSTPELVVSIQAALGGQPDMAVGNVMGSNVFNIAVILGLSALVCPLRVQLSTIRIDTPLMIGATLVVVWLLAGSGISRPAGFLLVLALIGFTTWTVVQARRQSSTAIEREFSDGLPKPARFMWRELLFILGGLGLLVAGSRFLVASASDLARHFGVSEAVIAVTLVAAGTSIPELATSVVAALRRQPDIAVGNIVGSNVFNLLGILGAGAMVAPLKAPGIDGFDLAVLLAFSIVLLPLIRTGRVVTRGEGLLLLAAYLGYLGVLLAGSA